MNSKTIRKLNTASVFHAIRRHPGVSQSRLRGVTNIDRSTISTIVQQLESDGLIKKSKSAASGMGRPEDVLEVVSGAGSLVGIAIGNASLQVSIAGLDGVMRSTAEVQTPSDDSQFMSCLTKAFDAALAKFQSTLPKVRGVGLALADPTTPSGKAWRKTPLVQDIEALIKAPVLVENDMAASALGELQFGLARGVGNFVYVHSRAELRGALVLGGKIYRGHAGSAGSLAHVKVEANGRRCTCGALGCLQAYVSEPALMSRLAEFNHPSRSIRELNDAARSNDVLARTVISEAGAYLGFALSNAVNFLRLEEVVLGGDLATLSEHLMPALRQTLTRNDVEPSRRVTVRKSTWEKDEVPMGTIALALASFLPGQTAVGPSNESFD